MLISVVRSKTLDHASITFHSVGGRRAPNVSRTTLINSSKQTHTHTHSCAGTTTVQTADATLLTSVFIADIVKRDPLFDALYDSIRRCDACSRRLRGQAGSAIDIAGIPCGLLSDSAKFSRTHDFAVASADKRQQHVFRIPRARARADESDNIYDMVADGVCLCRSLGAVEL